MDSLGLRARGGMRGEGWRLTWEPTNMLLAVYDGYIESVACLGSREALPHTRLAATGSKASASLRKAATCCLALRGCRSIQYGGIPFVIRHMCMRGDQIPFGPFLLHMCVGPRIRGPGIQRSTRKESRPSNKRDCDPHTPIGTCRSRRWSSTPCS